MIGLPEDKVRRAYSITSGPYDDYLEFYSIKVSNGPLTSKLQHIKVGDLLDVGEDYWYIGNSKLRTCTFMVNGNRHRYCNLLVYLEIPHTQSLIRLLYVG